MSAIHALVIDDSAVVRQVMTTILGAEMYVTTAADPIIAMRKIEAQRPDVILLDIEMPRMDGLTFLGKLMEEDPIPVVVCSARTSASSSATMRALQLGAVDVVLKPRIRLDEPADPSVIALLDAVRAAAVAKVGRRTARKRPAPRVAIPAARVATSGNGRKDAIDRVIVLGASTGGTEVLKQILDEMPADAPPIVIVQHMPERFTAAFARRLNESSQMEVREAVSGDRLENGLALVAPGDRHMSISRGGPNIFTVAVFDGDLVNRHRPSIDVLFQSAAHACGSAAVAALLTGMGRDGAKGLLDIRKSGGATFAQDEASSVVFGMPKAAMELEAVQHVRPADAMAASLVEVCRSS